MASNALKERLSEVIDGDVLIDEETLEHFSRDASLFKIRPKVVVQPKHVKDVQSIISFVSHNQKDFPGLAITGRAAGTCMSGGAIGEGIIVDFSKYFNEEEIDVANLKATVQPGVYFRDFEKISLPEKVSMPVYPASKSLAAFGGMIMNNCGGEKTLRYGQMRKFVTSLKVVLADGNEYEFGKITLQELEKKKKLDTFEGEIYRNIHALIVDNYNTIQAAKPKTAKNSSGYALWEVYDKEAETFDLAQLFTGSQGTLGLMSEAEIRLVESEPYKRLVTVFSNSWDTIPEVVNELSSIGVEGMETFDDTTLKLGLKFMPEIAKKVGKNFFSFALQFIPEAIIGMKMLGLPKVIILVQISENSEVVADRKANAVIDALKDNKVHARIIKTEAEAEKFWVMRRESFNLLRNKVKDKQTAPFIDDFCVLPEKLPVVLPAILKILKDNKIPVNVVGHAGSGNLHIIPLMNLNDEKERAKIAPVSTEVYDLVIKHGGTITAEHNDGIIRTPYVEQMFGEELYSIFKEVKNIFDPKNIFNPGKKVGGTVKYMEEHIVGR